MVKMFHAIRAAATAGGNEGLRDKRSERRLFSSSRFRQHEFARGVKDAAYISHLETLTLHLQIPNHRGGCLP